MLESLYEELILLDEIAGELSPEDNAANDTRRAELVREINELETLGSRWG